jgi:hypothetical protein
MLVASRVALGLRAVFKSEPYLVLRAGRPRLGCMPFKHVPIVAYLACLIVTEACGRLRIIFGVRLPDSKTGAKVVYLNAPALAVLKELPRVEGNPCVIAGRDVGKPFNGMGKVWIRVRTRAADRRSAS